MKPLVVILGPTAVGKTSVGIKLCQAINGEIISGDSMLIYKGMDIGTAKPSLAEREGVPHFMIDILEPDEVYSVAEFQARAVQYIDEIHERGKIPVLLGGTGLYIRAITEGYEFSPAGSNDGLRNQLHHEARLLGNEYIWGKLLHLDPPTAKRLHVNDLRRIIRALEIYYATGKPLSQQYTASPERMYDLAIVGLTMPRELLYQRINKRVEQMLAQGLEKEARSLLAAGYRADMASLKGLGYRQMIGYLHGEYDLEYAAYLIKRDTRHFAKRQITLYKKIPGITWFDVTKYPSLSALVEVIDNSVAGKISI